MSDLLLETFDPRLQRFFAYWNGLRRGRPFPTRRDLDPAEFAYVLGYVTLVEVQYEPLRFRFRLHGSELVRHGGYDMTGKYAEELPGEENKRAFLERCHSVLSSREPQLARAARVLDGRTIQIEAVWVPLSEDGVVINMLVRALVYRNSLPQKSGRRYYESGPVIRRQQVTQAAEQSSPSSIKPASRDESLEGVALLDHRLLEGVQEQCNRDFITAWQRWRGQNRLLPKRSDVDLSEIKHLLGRVVLLELRDHDDILVRVAGSQLREHAGFEATGRNFRDLTPPDEWPVRRWHLNQMAARPCGGALISRDNGVTFEGVTLPLEPEDPGKPRLLISNLAVLGGNREPAAKDRPQIIGLADEFRFLDLGAGTPDRITP